ncbi:MAG: hypothetical protein LBR20_03190, partial [Propionibacteriaceae bacterium]|nr:hypothetical protein [Propionibacteriaceae bacterium]
GRRFSNLAGLVVSQVEWLGWQNEHQFGTNCRSAAGYHNPAIEDLHKTKQQTEPRAQRVVGGGTTGGRAVAAREGKRQGDHR